MVHGDFSDAFQPATFRLRQANERMVLRCLTNNAQPCWVTTTDESMMIALGWE